jgi:hypothetical protein
MGILTANMQKQISQKKPSGGGTILNNFSFYRIFLERLLNFLRRSPASDSEQAVLKAELWIRIHPDPAFLLNPNTDPDPKPGSRVLMTKN